MVYSITRDDIDFDWAYLQMRCLEDDTIAAVIAEIYPEMNDSQDFLNEFNLVQDHRALQALAALADTIDAAFAQLGQTVNLERKINAAEKLLRSHLQKRLQRMRVLLEKVSQDDESEVLMDQNMHLHDNELMQMLPMFYDFTLATTDSVFFAERVSRDIAFKAFGRLLKSSDSQLAKLKDDYRALLGQQHCFLSLAPFDNDFKQAEQRFVIGENNYLTPLDLVTDIADAKDSEAEDLVEIRLIKPSIMDRRKLEEGELARICPTKAETLIVLGKAILVEAHDHKRPDAPPAPSDATIPPDSVHMAADAQSHDTRAGDQRAAARPIISQQLFKQSAVGASPLAFLAVFILLMVAGWFAGQN